MTEALRSGREYAFKEIAIFLGTEIQTSLPVEIKIRTLFEEIASGGFYYRIVVDAPISFETEMETSEFHKGVKEAIRIFLDSTPVVESPSP